MIGLTSLPQIIQCLVPSPDSLLNAWPHDIKFSELFVQVLVKNHAIDIDPLSLSHWTIIFLIGFNHLLLLITYLRI